MAERDREGDYSDATQQTYRGHLRGFFRWCQAQGLDPAHLGRGDVARWRGWLRKERGYSPATVNVRLAAVKAFYSWACERDLVAGDPCRGVRRVKSRGAAAAREALADEEVLAVLDTCEDNDVGRRDMAILSLLAYCGLRLVEIRRAQWEDLQVRSGRLTLNVWGKGRSGPDEFMVLPQAVVDPLRDWMRAHPGGARGPLFVSLSRRTRGRLLSLSYLRRMVKRRYRDAGVFDPRKSAHSLRHSFISKAVSALGPLGAQQLARHGDVRTTIRYLQRGERLADPGEDRIVYRQPAPELDAAEAGQPGRPDLAQQRLQDGREQPDHDNP